MSDTFQFLDLPVYIQLWVAETHPFIFWRVSLLSRRFALIFLNLVDRGGRGVSRRDKRYTITSDERAGLRDLSVDRLRRAEKWMRFRVNVGVMVRFEFSTTVAPSGYLCSFNDQPCWSDTDYNDETGIRERSRQEWRLHGDLFRRDNNLPVVVLVTLRTDSYVHSTPFRRYRLWLVYRGSNGFDEYRGNIGTRSLKLVEKISFPLDRVRRLSYMTKILNPGDGCCFGHLRQQRWDPAISVPASWKYEYEPPAAILTSPRSHCESSTCRLRRSLGKRCSHCR